MGRPKGTKQKRCRRGHDLTKRRNLYYHNNGSGKRECALCSIRRAKKQVIQRRKMRIEAKRVARAIARAKKLKLRTAA